MASLPRWAQPPLCRDAHRLGGAPVQRTQCTTVQDSSHSTVPRVLTTIHWIPSAKDLCWSQTHLKWGNTASRPGKCGCSPSHTPKPQALMSPRLRHRLPRWKAPHRGMVLSCHCCRGPAGTPQELQNSTLARCKGRFWTTVKPRPEAYRKVAVSAGMLLRNVKIITTNMKTRRRGFL